jgi:hypothetical protein
MNIDEIKHEIKIFCEAECFPVAKMIIGAGASLVMHGIREECNDIDVELEDSYFASLRDEGLKTVEFTCGFTGRTRKLIRWANIDIHREGEFFVDAPKPEIDVIDGFHVHSVKTVYEMKKRLNREKDQKDLRLMEQYMDANGIKYEPRLKKLSDALKIQCVNENPNKFA